MKRNIWVAYVAILALLCAGIGAVVVSDQHQSATRASSVGVSGPTEPVTPPGSATPCTPENYSMQCGLQNQPAAPKLLSTPLGAIRATGIDFGWGGPSVAWMQASHFSFGASYYSWDSSKNWGAGQVASYHAAHIATVGAWESTAARALGGYAAGVADAVQARKEARAVGEPNNRPIYFAVDFDTHGYGCAICGYFRGVDHTLGVNHTGAYGGITTIQTLFGARLITYGWQTYAWSGNQVDRRAQLYQYLNGSSVDWDRALAKDYGQWPYSNKPLNPVCYHHRLPVAKCAAVRAQVSKWSKAVRSTNAALKHVRSVLAAHHCRKPYRRAVCVDYGRLNRVLTQRARWFSTQIHTTTAKS